MSPQQTENLKSQNKSASKPVVAFFDSRRYDRESFLAANHKFGFQFLFLETRLTESTADLVPMGAIVCSFVNDQLSESTLSRLKSRQVKLVALRSAGYNHVDLKAAEQLGLTIVRVPEYSPYAVAEHAVALLLSLNRKIHRASNRVREMNFSLEGLVGFDLHGKTVGVVGLGRIGLAFARIMRGFGCRVLAYDLKPRSEHEKDIGLKYTDLQELLRESDIISLHVPLNRETRHIFSAEAFEKVKKDLVLINTGRGALIDSRALIKALKSHRIGGACLDVYEEEEGVFFSDFSESGIEDDLLARLLTFPNVLITSHQAFLTREALQNIADTTLTSFQAFLDGQTLQNQVSWSTHGPR
ncbi:MAG: 2-hydroxyacid dehydrogenase [Bdellovibrionales bacterium]